MIRIHFLYLLMLLLSIKAYAQEGEKKSKFNWLDISGFINHSVKYDSRQTVTAREGELLLYPKPVIPDEIGSDKNDFGKLQMFNFHSRLRFNIKGKEFVGFNTGAVLETDFFGSSNGTIATARLRHAYIHLNNEKIGIILGQTWHPAFVTECFPEVVAWGAAIPIQPFSRAPQVRLTYTPIKELEVSISALSQRDFPNSGPLGPSGDYLRDSGIPEMQIRLITRPGNNFVAGLVAGYKTIVPRLSTDKNLAYKESISSYNIGGFAKLSSERFFLKLHGIYGENLTNLLLIGGYGVKEIDEETDIRTYENYESLAIWSEAEYQLNEWRVGFFAGHVAAPDHNSKHEIYYYGLGSDLESLTRWSPRLVYVMNKLSFGLELSTTTAKYTDFYNGGQLISRHSVTNYRYIFSSIFKF